MIQKIQIRISNRGVPHNIITIDNVEYSFCFMGNGKFYRVWEYGIQRKLGDIILEKGDMIDIEGWISSKIEELVESNR